MSMAVKKLVEADYRQRYADLDSMLVVNVHGLTGIDANNFRRRLFEKKIELHVVKNSAVRRIFVGTPLEPLGAALEGPCALVTAEDGAIGAAKTLIEMQKDFPALELRFGLVDAEPDVLSVEEISKRKSREELIGEVIMLAMSPGRRLAGCLNVGGRISGCIKAIAEKLEKGETIQKVA